MLSSSFLDVTIGVVLVFVMLSLIASTVNEIANSLLNMRGRKLLLGLQTLLDDTDTTKNGLVEKIYNHGQIFGLFEGAFHAKKTGNLPSYIPPQNFVMAMLDIVSKLAPAPAAVPVPAPAAPPSTLPAELVSLWHGAKKLAADSKTTKAGIPLLSMVEAAKDLSSLETSVKDWYNSAMDRVSGWYRYHTQWMLLGIGVVLAVTLNADTVNIAQQLSKNATLRESVVAAAQAYRPKTSSETKADQTKSDQAKPDPANSPASEKKSQEESNPDLSKKLNDVSTGISTVKELGIPLGWPLSKSQEHTSLFWEIMSSGFGWLLTAIAVSLGAPFWFDILNKFMIVRSTVKPGEKSQPSKQK
jgi:hypothetical protein